MTDQTVNIPLLRKAVEWAEAEAAKPPELCKWEQTLYYLPAESVGGLGRASECGSCFCIAGYVVSLEYPETVMDARDSDIAQLAANMLGLGWAAGQLFRSNNTIEDVRRIAESLAGERL